MVVTWAPSSSRRVTLQLVTARPSMITVHAPQSLLSQPYFVPVRLDASRSPHSGGVEGASLKKTASPFTVIRAMRARLARLRARCQDDAHAPRHHQQRL